MRSARVLAVAALLSVALCPATFSFEEFTEAQKASAEKAVKWLLKAQNRDGSWGLDANTPGDITCTALAAMVLMECGTTERDGEPEKVKALRGAIEYILKAARSNRGDIEKSETTLIQGKLGRRVHNFFGVIFLTQLYGMRSPGGGGSGGDENSELRETIQKLSDIIAKSQESDGSWHKDTWGSLKATGMAWMALRAAASTGVPIQNAAVDRTVKFIKNQYNSRSKLYDSGGKLQSYQALYATATCVRVMEGMGEGSSKECSDAEETFIQQCRSGQWGQMFLTIEGEDYLSAVIFTHSLIHRSDNRWQTWFEYIRGALMKRQNADGSWVTTACITGRTFATACAALTLYAPNRLTPMQQ
ncbi:MAG TPA: prenyltransferase/squalene oxidase repeat-containing protein [Planctomycetota bacterium]|nr:prenyltransferase/squalene oxidase repeat-containing protein [Planctomycetota bacterium]